MVGRRKAADDDKSSPKRRKKSLPKQDEVRTEDLAERPNTETDNIDKNESDEEGGIRFDDIYVPPPPATAFQCNPDGSRLIITKIVNENFKSYANVQELGPFHKYFTAIIGPNGSGKSNVIDSMLFVFGYRAAKLRSKKLSALLHDSPTYDKVTSCTVTIHFALMIDIEESADAYITKPGSEFYISRTACIDNSSYYTINGKRSQFKEVGKLLRTHGIDLDHNRFLILQGEVEQISLMKPKAETEGGEVGMLEYLEDIIGSSRFKVPIEELDKRVKLLSDVRQEKMDRCKMVKAELDDLRAPMEAALRYVQLENTIILLKHKQQQKKIQVGKQEKEDKLEVFKKLEENMKVLKKELEERRRIIKEKEEANSSKKKDIEKTSQLKEKAKAAFEATKVNDVSIQQEIENANKKRNETAKAVAAEEEKLIKLKKVPEKNKQTIAELETLDITLEKERFAAEEKQVAVMATLQEDTVTLQEEKETLQTELVQLKKVVDKTKSKYDMSKTELELYVDQEAKERAKLEDVKKRYEETVNGLKEGEQKLGVLNVEIPEKERELKSCEAELKTSKEDERRVEESRRKQQLSLEEARMSMHSNRGRGRVLDSLMQQKAEGRLPGIFGRMGDLGGIDEKYDVAISTACGPLDHIVVDTVDTATACIDYLKRNNVGQGTFVALEKQERYRDVYSRPFRAPENVPRLFDLIKVADERVRPVFYFALQDTLVAENLDQAMRIAYGKTRHRVVTLSGELIETAGTMSGGGNTVLKGRMGRRAEQITAEVVSPRNMNQMQQKLEDTIARLTQVRNRIGQLEDRISQLEAELRGKRQQQSKMDIEVRSLRSQEPMLKSQVKAQETKFKDAALDKKKLATLNKAVEKSKEELDKATSESDVIEKQVDKLHAEIIAKTKGRLDAAQKKLNEATEKLDKARKEKTRLKVAITTAERNIKKSEEKLTNMKQEIETCVGKIKKGAAELEANEKEAQKSLAEFESLTEKLQEMLKGNSGVTKELDALLKEENGLKAKEIDVKEELSKAKADVDHRQMRINADKKILQSLKLIDEPANEEKVELKEYTDEELEEININDLSEEIKNKESSLPKVRPNLGAIQEFVKKQKVYQERESDLEKATNDRNKTRSVLEEFKRTRLTEFMKGFSIICQKVKECYQMLAEGGDAELELANTMDPFLDGIRFTVRPPKKSWKEIQFLSGGEKTLSSLALIFALHYYKPTPLYFMDEIDSALDWKNTAIVGLYLKEQTKNAQFIIVSLRENMFELADQLAGIYKTNNCTKTVTIVPSNYSSKEVTEYLHNVAASSNNQSL